jgi:hypothetical protein
MTVQHIDHPVAEAPQKEKRADQGKDDGVTLPVRAAEHIEE